MMLVGYFGSLGPAARPKSQETERDLQKVETNSTFGLASPFHSLSLSSPLSYPLPLPIIPFPSSSLYIHLLQLTLIASFKFTSTLLNFLEEQHNNTDWLS